jgi:hypothetical protein
MPECAHDELEFNASLINIEQPPFRFVRVRARCVTCFEFFHWRGIASGHPNPEEPVVSADGYELRAPIVAGPGAVVGLLERTGLGDVLVQPQNGQGA